MIVREPSDRWIALTIIGLIYSVSIADRLVMSTLIQPLKLEFGLTDTSIGFVTGTAFAVLYTFACVPFGVLADKSNRKWFAGACGIFFSAMTILSGMSRNFALLLLSRLGVVIGEAGYTPTALSLLSDKFLAPRRAAVITLYTLAVPIGAWLGASGAAYLERHYDWRTVIEVFGWLGVILSALFLVLISEARRGVMDGPAAMAQDKVAITGSLRLFMSQRSVLHSFIGANVMTFWAWGLIWWAPAFLSRSFGVSTDEAGMILGTLHGAIGGVSTLVAAGLLYLLARRDPRGPYWFLAGLGAISTLPAIAAVFETQTSSVSILLGTLMPIAYVYAGISLAGITAAVPANIRGQAVAVYTATTNFTTLALAPQLVGIASDLIAPHVAKPAESLRYALMPLAVTGFWASAHFWIAARHVRADLERLATGVASSA